MDIRTKNLHGLRLVPGTLPGAGSFTLQDTEKTHPLDLDLIKSERLAMEKQGSANGI